jgi:hypothetical protein
MHSSSNSFIQGTINIGVIFTPGICVVLTQLAYASSGPIPVTLIYLAFNSEIFLSMSRDIESEVEEGSKKMLGSNTNEKKLSNEMSLSDGRKSTLPFEFELPIPFP